MTKEQFMTQLEDQLKDISYEERQAALRYYEEYFEDAGEDEEAMGQLESPEQIAKVIKEDLDIKLQLAKSSNTEKSTNNQERAEKHESASNGHNTSNDNSSRSSLSSGKIALIVIAAIIFSPIIFGGAGTVIGIITSLVAVAVAFTFAGVALIISGIITIGIGITLLFTSLLEGFFTIGVGLIVVGLGCFFTYLTILFWGYVIPQLIRIIREGIQHISGKGREKTQ